MKRKNQKLNSPFIKRDLCKTKISYSQKMKKKMLKHSN